MVLFQNLAWLKTHGWCAKRKIIHRKVISFVVICTPLKAIKIDCYEIGQVEALSEKYLGSCTFLTYLLNNYYVNWTYVYIFCLFTNSLLKGKENIFHI